MKKFMSIILILLLLLGIFIPIAYAEPIQEIEQGKAIELELDLSSLEYNNIYIIIKNNSSIKDISIPEAADSSTLSQIVVEKIEGYKYILVNKTDLLDKKIKLNIDLIDNIQVDTVVNIETATSDESINISELQFTLNSYKIVVANKNGDNGAVNSNTGNETGGETGTGNGIGTGNAPDNNQNVQLPTGNGTIQSAEQVGNQATNSMANTKSTITQKSTSVFSGNSTSTTQTVTYNGSQNNYLSSLSVTNYSLNTEFNKTNNTYFISVGADVTNIDISYEENDSTQTVKIYGNKNLSVGLNKVLISVTAENGSVREYRIYVTKA